MTGEFHAEAKTWKQRSGTPSRFGVTVWRDKPKRVAPVSESGRHATAGSPGDSSIDEDPAAQPLCVCRKYAICSIRNVDFANLPGLSEVDIHVQGMLPIGRILVRVWQMHVLLAAIGREQHALPIAKHAEVGVVCGRRCRSREECANRNREDQALLH